MQLHTGQNQLEGLGERARARGQQPTLGSGTLFVIPALHPPIPLEFAGNRLLSWCHQVKLGFGYLALVPKQDFHIFRPNINVVDEEWSPDTALERRHSACIVMHANCHRG